MEKKSFSLRMGQPRALGQDQGNVRQILLLSLNSLAVIFQILVLPFFLIFVRKHIPTLHSDSTVLCCLPSLCRSLMGMDNLSRICEYVILTDSKEDKYKISILQNVNRDLCHVKPAALDANCQQTHSLSYENNERSEKKCDSLPFN